MSSFLCSSNCLFCRHLPVMLQQCEQCSGTLYSLTQTHTRLHTHTSLNSHSHICQFRLFSVLETVLFNVYETVSSVRIRFKNLAYATPPASVQVSVTVCCSAQNSVCQTAQIWHHRLLNRVRISVRIRFKNLNKSEMYNRKLKGTEKLRNERKLSFFQQK